MTCLLTNVAWAEVAGTPLPSGPNPYPHFWARFGNDVFGILSENHDDWRTFQLGGGLRVSDNWIAVVDVSGFTDRDNPTGGTRIDQITASLGWHDTIDSFLRARHTEWSVGSGIQASGNFGLDAMQNSLHKILDGDPVYLDYEDVHEIHLTAWGSWNQIWDFLIYEHSRIGLALPAQTMISHEGQFSASAGSNLFYARDWFQIWGGMNAEMRADGGYSTTIEQAFNQERGLYATLGVGLGPITFEFSTNVDNGYGYGWFEIQQSAESATTVVEQQTSDIIDVGIGSDLTTFSWRSDIAWFPTWLPRGSVDQWYSGLTLSFISGNTADEWPDYEGYHNSLSIGPAVRWRPIPQSARWLHLQAAARVGWQQTSFVRLDGGDSTIPQEDTTFAAADLLMLFHLFGDNTYAWTPRSIQFALGLTGHAPLEGSKTVSNGTETVDIHKPILTGTFMLNITFLY